jgi:hypothetical protein
MQKLTSLEPRTPRQPEKLESRQRTIQFYTFYFFRQRKIALCKWMYFQSSAARSQACDRIWCSGKFDFLNSCRNQRFQEEKFSRISSLPALANCSAIVKNRETPRPARDSCGDSRPRLSSRAKLDRVFPAAPQCWCGAMCPDRTSRSQCPLPQN